MWAIGCVFAEMLRRVPLFNVSIIQNHSKSFKTSSKRKTTATTFFVEKKLWQVTKVWDCWPHTLHYARFALSAQFVDKKYDVLVLTKCGFNLTTHLRMVCIECFYQQWFITCEKSVIRTLYFHIIISIQKKKCKEIVKLNIFQGNTDIEQLALVIKILGSPNSKDWPEMDALPDFKKIQ